jgi:hypothetical protein
MPDTKMYKITETVHIEGSEETKEILRATTRRLSKARREWHEFTPTDGVTIRLNWYVLDMTTIGADLPGVFPTEPTKTKTFE